MTGLTELKYFLAVARTANVSRAAELCGISQPALSQALKRLENELGTSLLSRGKTGVRLTRAGEKFAKEGHELIAKWQAVANSVHATEKSVSGHYTIGCHPSVAIYSLPRFMGNLQSRYPDLNIGLTHGLSREVALEVIEFRLDFGIVINPPRHPDLVIRELGVDEVTLWVNREYDSPDVLILEPSLLQSQSILKQMKRRKISIRRKIESTSLEVIYAMTAAGAGIGVLPTRVARNPFGPELSPYCAKAPVFKDRLCLVFRAGTQHQAGARAIIDAITRAGI